MFSNLHILIQGLTVNGEIAAVRVDPGGEAGVGRGGREAPFGFVHFLEDLKLCQMLPRP